MSFRSRPVFKRAQRGATLVVVLVLLLVMTLLGLASLSSTVLEERMTANLLDRSLSFQNAESALREAEARLALAPTFPALGAPCNAGLCPAPDPSAPERWIDTTFTGWHTAAAADPNAPVPQYFVEALGEGPNWPFCEQELPPNPNCMKPRFRITSRSTQQGRATVVLQTIFAGS